MNKKVKIIVELALLVVIALLTWLIVRSVMEPVEFNKQKEARENVAIQRLKDIRTLQVAFKSVTGRYASTIDSLKLFYETGAIPIVMQVGSLDDSLAVAHTEQVKKQFRGKVKGEDLYELYKAGDKNLVFSVERKIAVKDTIFRSRTDFVPDSLKVIPFSGGQPVEMTSITKMVSGVQVPLFEAKMSYRALLKGLDNQLRVNLDAERRAQNKFEGLQVGSISAPNNNAGNWE